MFGELHERAAGATARVIHEWLLGSNRSLCGVLIERHDREDRRAKMPFALGRGVMVTRVEAIQHKADALPLDARVTLEMVQRGARVPQSDEIRAGDEQPLVCA